MILTSKVDPQSSRKAPSAKRCVNACLPKVGGSAWRSRKDVCLEMSRRTNIQSVSSHD